MTTKFGATVVALLMASLAVAGLATAYVPSGATTTIGPETNGITSCNTAGTGFLVLPVCPAGPSGPSTDPSYCTNNPEHLGYGGSDTGTTTGYHRYANDQTIGLLDFCNALFGPPGWAACVAAAQTTDITNAADDVPPVTEPAVFEALNEGTNSLLNGAGLYQDQCAGILGTGSDGTFEYGSAEAAINVRLGSTTEPAFADGAADPSGNAGVATAGAGANSCIGPAAKADSGSDNVIYVGDAVQGGQVGFRVFADWSQPSYLSSDGQDDNAVATTGISHCGDVVFDPCTSGTGDNSAVTDVENGGGDAVAVDVPQVIANGVPTTSAILASDDNILLGACNPLDYGVHVDASGKATRLDGGAATNGCGDENTAAHPAPSATTPNCWDYGAALKGFGNGGASGYLYVILDQPGVRACYDVSGGASCLNGVSTNPVGVGAGVASVTTNVALGGAGNIDGLAPTPATVQNVPTFGWIWTGA